MQRGRRSGGPERMWTRRFVMAVVVNFFIATVFYLLLTTMAVHAADRFAVGEAAAGAASTLFVVGALIARVFAGRIVDAIGSRRALLAGLVGFLGSALAYLVADSLPFLLGVRLAHGVAFGMCSTAVTAVAYGLIPTARRGEGIGYFTSSATVATAVGPALGMVLVDDDRGRALFVATIVAAALALGAGFGVRAPQVAPAPAQPGITGLVAREAVPVSSIMLITGAAYGSVLAFLDPYARSADLSAGAGSFFVAYATVVLISRIVGGKVQDRWGDDVVVYPALGSFALGLGVLALARTDAAIVVAGALVGLGFGTLMSTALTIAVNTLPATRVGVAVSTYFVMLDLGTGLGPLALGVLAEATGYRTMYSTAAAAVLASALLYRLIARRGAAAPA